MIHNLRNALLLMAVVAIILALMFNEILAYAAIFVGAMVIFYGLYYAFLRTKDQEIENLRVKLENEETQLSNVKSENSELRNRKLNLSAVKQILDVGLFEIDTNFTRTWNEEMEVDNQKKVQFIGALKVNMTAKYGVDLKELKIKQTDSDVFIGNMELKSLSFTDLDYDWVISEVLEHKKPYLGQSHRRTNPILELEGNKIKERLQKKIHEEVKNGPEEVNAVIGILKKQLTHSVASLLGLQDKHVHFVQEIDSDFKALEDSNLMDN